jgi:hypothetical protein
MIRDLGKSIMEAQRYRPVPGPVTRNEEALPKIE